MYLYKNTAKLTVMPIANYWVTNVIFEKLK